MTRTSSPSSAATLGGRAVRQAEEHDVVPGEVLGVGGVEHAVGERQQVRLVLAEPVPGVRRRGERPRW